MSFLRHENKYIITKQQAELIRGRIGAFMPLDTHCPPCGYYHIRSLYFDTLYDDFYGENEAGVDNRDKYRIRIYDHSDIIKMEIKSKINGFTAKRSCGITREQFDAILAGKYMPPDSSQSPVWNSFMAEYYTRPMKPAAIVDYDRVPFVYPDGNVRVTLDSNISSDEHFDAFFSEKRAGRPILPSDRLILEVKYDEFLPDFILSSLNLDNLQRESFSKYYLCRKFDLYGRKRYGY